MLLSVIRIITLCIPTGWEIFRDRKGDVHPNNDWLLRGVLMVCVSVIDAIIIPGKNIIQNFVLSFGIFTLVFPWAIKFVHVKNNVIELPRGKKWFQHVSKKAWPEKTNWGLMPWWVRLVIALMFFTGCCIVFNCWGKLISFYNAC